MSGYRSEAGRLFQIFGPATEKLLSPSRVFVLVTVKTLAWAERRWGRVPICYALRMFRSPAATYKYSRSDKMCFILHSS